MDIIYESREAVVEIEAGLAQSLRSALKEPVLLVRCNQR